MTLDITINYYVPAWYQKRFLPPALKNRELYYLDLQPGTFVDGRDGNSPKKISIIAMKGESA